MLTKSNNSIGVATDIVHFRYLSQENGKAWYPDGVNQTMLVAYKSVDMATEVNEAQVGDWITAS